MEKERTYLMRRAAQERSAADHASVEVHLQQDALADHASGMAARSAHLELERRYRERIDTSTADAAAAAG